MLYAPTIKTIAKIPLAGLNQRMSLVENHTHQLWNRFMSQYAGKEHTFSSEFYSVQIYPDLHYFDAFNPHTLFTKWAAVPISTYHSIPKEWDRLTIPEGTYAVFHYKGHVSKVPNAMQFVFSEWLPNSGYQLEPRPHFSVMGKHYSNTSPDSEEDFYIPVKEYR